MSISFGVFLLVVIGLFLISYFAFKKILAAKKRESEIIITHKNKLIQSNLEVQEKERIRIASELHDGIIGKIAAIRLQVALQAPEKILDYQLGDTIDEVRKLSHDLYPPMYETHTLDVIVDNIFIHYKNVYDIITHYHVDKSIELPLREKVQLLRIVQELLRNIDKHAHATQLIFKLRITQKLTSLSFTDNGVGFDVVKQSGGQGLQNIELRCMSINAHYKYKSKEYAGTQFILYCKHGTH